MADELTTSDAVAQYLDEQRRDMASQARYTMGSAITAKPDYEAELRKVARSTGVPVDTVREYPDEMKKQAALQSFDFDAMASDFPRTAAFLVGNENAAIAHDDTDNLSGVERTLKFLGNSGRALAASLPSASAGVGGVLQAAAEGVAPILDPLAGTILPENPLRRVAAGFAGMRRQAEADAKALQPKSSGNIEAGYYSGLQSLGQNLLMLPAAIATGNPALATVGMSIPVGGQAYGQARDKGLGVVQSATFGASQAAIEYATEKLPMSRLLGDLKAGTPFYRMLMRNMAAEIPGEQAATILQDLNEWAVINPDKPFSDYLAARPDAAVQTLVATIVGVGGQVSVVRGIDAVLNRDQNQQREAQAAEQNAQAIAELNTLAAASKVRARDGQTFDQFVASATQDGDIQDLYISAQTLAQSGLAEQVAAASPSVQQQLAQALETGGDIRIPLAEYATTIAPEGYAQGLVEHLKTDPQGFSQAEAAQYMEQRGEQLQQEIEQTLAQQTAQQQLEAGREEVQADLLAQLERAKRFTSDANQSYATLAGSFYAVQAARLGITPQEMYARYPLRIVAQQPLQNAVFDQAQRGSFDPETNTIALLKNADLTTFLHESGHFNLETLADIASRPDAPADIRADMDALLQWFGVESERDADALTVWNRRSMEEKRQAHEKFARGFEAYLFEGKAPSVELRSIFQRFRAWLLNVYKKISSLDVRLTPEVRSVMDRMLATADEIQSTEAANSMGMLFETPEQAAEFGVDWRQYHDQGLQATQDAVTDLEARGMRDMKWLNNARSRALKDLQKQAAGRRKEVEAEVRSEIMSQPLYQAWEALTRKIGPNTAGADSPDFPAYRLKTEDLRAAYGTAEDAIWRKLSARGMTSDARGLNPDIVAEQFGYGSGDQMVQDLATARPPEEAIAELTDARMLERYSELATPEALDAAANEAVHNAARGRFIATEQAALQRALDARGQNDGRVFSILPKAAQDFAGQLISRLRVRDVKPAQYRAAEARSARDAQAALRASDLPAAALASRNQLLNFHAAKAAQDALVEVDKAIDYFRRVENSKTIDPEYKEQIDGLLEQYDLRRSTTLREVDRRKSLSQWVETQRELGLEPDVPAQLLENARTQSYRDMTVEELRGLRDTIRQIEKLGRLKEKMLSRKEKKEFEAVRDEMAASILANSRGRKSDARTPTTRLGGWFQKAKNFGAAHIKAATWARIMDGGKAGPVWDYLIRPANERGDMETTMRAEATSRLSEIMAPVLKQKGFRKNTYFKSIDRSLNREAVIAIALNTGNASNLQRLLGGEGWTMDQIRPVLDTMTEVEWNAVQSVWDYFESFRPQVAEKQRRVYGTQPDWIEPTPVVTKFGTKRGGYYPVKYDPVASIHAEQHADAEEARIQLKGAYSAATTRRSFTKTRAEEVNGRPLLYNLQGMYGGINEVIHDLAWHEWLIDANRLLKSREIDDAIRFTYGPEAVKQLKTWRDAIAVGDGGSQEALDVALGRLRQGVSVAGLGFNVMSAAMQPLGLTQSIVRVGGRWIGKGVLSYVSNPVARVREVNAKSEFMANRGRTRFRELNELRNRVQGQTAARERLNAGAYVLMMKFQQTVDIPTWLGAYEKATAEGESEARAVALADQAVIDSQGGGQTKDLSAIERGGPGLKLFTVFYSFMNTALNVGIAQGLTNKAAAKTAVDMAMLFVVPAVLGAVLKDALTPGGGDEDDEKLFKKLASAQLDYLFGLFVVGREFGEAANILVGLSEYSRDYSGPGGLRVIGDTYKLSMQANQAEFDDSFRKAAINLMGSMFGLPAAQINRTVTGIQALESGETENPAAIVFGFQRN